MTKKRIIDIDASGKALAVIVPGKSTELGKHAPLHVESNPAAIYLASLAKSGRPSMLSGLNAIANMVKTGSSAFSLPWGDLRYKHTQAIHARLVDEYGARSVNRMLSALRGVLKAAWNENQISTDDYHRAIQLKSMKTKSLPRAGRVLSQTELTKLTRACDRLGPQLRERNRALLAVLYAGGLRREEASSIDYADYVRSTGALTVTGKGRKTRIVYLQKTWRKLVEPWLDLRVDRSIKPMFVRFARHGPTPQRLGKKGVAKAVDTLQALAGVAPFATHDLRRSFATHLFKAGADPLMVQELMGHADLGTTKIYDLRGEDDKAAVIEKFFPDLLDDD